MDGVTSLFVRSGSTFELAAEYAGDSVPPYNEIQAMLAGREGSLASLPLMERLRREAEVARGPR